MYYLQSRYYNPVVGRFVNVDEAENIGISNSVLSHNLYTYSQNDPIDNIDYGGFFSWAIFKDLIQRIASLGKDLLEFILSHYGLSKKAYAKRTKYKEPGKLLEFVNANKSQIKNLKSGIADISKFMDILLTVADCAAILKNNRNTVVKIASLMFYGIIRLIGYLGSKLSWLLSKVFAALCWAKFIIEQLLNILVDWILNSKWVEKLNKKFLNYIDANSLTIGGYITALFKGAKDCLA